MRLPLLALFLAATANAQWDLQDSHTTASLRGIHALGGGVAWASGTGGTVLRTTDDGLSWQRCPTPPAAEHLDFRGIQAFDQTTAIVMSSGKGDLSRLYKTTDGCQSWKLVFTNPDKEGFWDAIQFSSKSFGVLAGDPIASRIYMRLTSNGGLTWQPFDNDDSLRVENNQGGFFAASNSNVILLENTIFAAANLDKGAALLVADFGTFCKGTKTRQLESTPCLKGYTGQISEQIPFTHLGESDGVFSLAKSTNYLDDSTVLVAVGGDYRRPDNSGSAAAARELKWQSAQTPPHGYRSAVAYSPDHKAWITVGPNGTDLSTDDGRNWRALKPGPTEPPDADRNWNALSLPFVVGPKGRIGRLRPDALPIPPQETPRP